MKTQMMTITQLAKVGFALSLLLLLTSCGSSSNNNAASPSSAISTSTTTTTTTTGTIPTALAYCNASTLNGLTANIETDYNSSSNSINPEYLRMKISALPSDFTSGSYIYFYRWQVDESTGEVNLDTTPLNYQIQDNAGNVYYDYQSGMSWANFSAISSAWGITDPSTLLNDLVLFIDTRDATGAYQVIKVGYYNSSNTVEVDMNMLMPVFAANPTTYATRTDGSSESQILTSLQPFESLISQGYSDSYFVNAANAYCF